MKASTVPSFATCVSLLFDSGRPKKMTHPRTSARWYTRACSYFQGEPQLCGRRHQARRRVYVAFSGPEVSLTYRFDDPSLRVHRHAVEAGPSIHQGVDIMDGVYRRTLESVDVQRAAAERRESAQVYKKNVSGFGHEWPRLVVHLANMFTIVYFSFTKSAYCLSIRLQEVAFV